MILSGLVVVIGALNLPHGCTPAYSPDTVKALEDLRDRAVTLYVALGSDAIPEKDIQAIKQDIDRLAATQAARPSNTMMTGQLGEIQNILDIHLKQRRDAGKWSPSMVEKATNQVTRAFESAIRIESARKPK
jgi:hypothetical protein